MLNVFYCFPRKKITYALFNGSFYYILEYFLYLYLKNIDINFYIICNKNLKNETEKKFKEYFSVRYNEIYLILIKFFYILAQFLNI